MATVKTYGRTQKEINQIVRAYQNDTKLQDILKKFKISSSTVYKILREETEFVGRNHYQERGTSQKVTQNATRNVMRTDVKTENKVLREYEKGTPISSISAKAEVSSFTVYSILHRAGVTPNRYRSRQTPKVDQRMVQQVKKLKKQVDDLWAWMTETK